MNRLKSTRSSLFLMELIIAILFFSLGSAVCVQAFVQAHLTTKAARELSFASTSVSSAASVVKYAGGGLADVWAYFPEAAQEADAVAVYYDGDFNACAGTEAVYTLRIRTEDGGGAESAHIAMTDAAGQVIYALDLRYPAGGEG